MMRRGLPIESVPIRNAVNSQIQYGFSFAEWEAMVAAGATLSEALAWERGEIFPPWFKARVIAWHRLRGLVQSHVHDAQNQAQAKGRKR